MLLVVASQFARLGVSSSVKPWFVLSILNIDLVPSACNSSDWARLSGLANVAEDLGLFPKAGLGFDYA